MFLSILQMNYANKNMLMGAMIVGGWDPVEGGQIYGVPIGGTLVQQAWTTDGSGSTYLWGYLDSTYRYILCSDAPHTSLETVLSALQQRINPFLYI